VNLELLFDPLFRLPFATGLLLAATLPALGLYLRLRNEWLAALGFAHLAAGGGVLGLLLALPVLPAALTLASAGVLAQGLVRRPGNDLYAAMILLGWTLVILGAAFSHHAQILGQALVDGQLYFTGLPQLLSALALAIIVGALLPALSPRLLRMRLFPGQDQANGRSERAAGLAFNALVAAGVGLSALCMGVMSAFATVFLPAWVAYALAPGWRAAVLLATGASVLCYLLAFAAALLLDAPFGPVYVAALLLLAPLRWLKRA
jgi:zinc/manganese transport system permease protein